jgi:hypothetical protein
MPLMDDIEFKFKSGATRESTADGIRKSYQFFEGMSGYLAAATDLSKIDGVMSCHSGACYSIWWFLAPR